jgi:hypothetical protein
MKETVQGFIAFWPIPEIRRSGVLPPTPVLAPGSALGSRPRVALSSAQVVSVYRGALRPGKRLLQDPGSPVDAGHCPFLLPHGHGGSALAGLSAVLASGIAPRARYVVQGCQRRLSTRASGQIAPEQCPALGGTTTPWRRAKDTIKHGSSPAGRRCRGTRAREPRCNSRCERFAQA